MDEEAEKIVETVEDENKVFTCADCSREFPEDSDTYKNTNGERICESCSDEYFHCESCDGLFSVEDCHSNDDGGCFCQECYDERYTTCDCGREIDTEYRDNYFVTVNGERICVRCYERNYFTCDGCNEVIHNDNYGGNDQCSDCYEPEPEYSDPEGIMDYSYKPESFEFHRANDEVKKPEWLGLELEIGMGRDNEGYSEVYDRFDGFMYCKTDSSIPGEGFEIVSHPASVAYWNQNRAGVADMFTALKRRGYKSHDAKSGGNECGLHVHINRGSLTSAQWIKLDFFVNANPRLFTALSRRNSTYSKYKKKSVRECGKSSDRYSAVNFCNSRTVELRMFRGSLNIKTFYATIELCQCLIEFMRVARSVDIVKPDHAERVFMDYIASSRFEELKEYAIKRGLVLRIESEEHD